ncbi:hypothetical protein LXL04_007048 [Taraxacum kok-saghyz]
MFKEFCINIKQTPFNISRNQSPISASSSSKNLPKLLVIIFSRFLLKLADLIACRVAGDNNFNDLRLPGVIFPILYIDLRGEAKTFTPPSTDLLLTNESSSITSISLISLFTISTFISISFSFAFNASTQALAAATFLSETTSAPPAFSVKYLYSKLVIVIVVLFKLDGSRARTVDSIKFFRFSSALNSDNFTVFNSSITDCSCLSDNSISDSVFGISCFIFSISSNVISFSFLAVSDSARNWLTVMDKFDAIELAFSVVDVTDSNFNFPFKIFAFRVSIVKSRFSSSFSNRLISSCIALSSFLITSMDAIKLKPSLLISSSSASNASFSAFILCNKSRVLAWFLIVSHEPAEVKKQAEPKYRSVSSRTEVPKRIKPNRSAEAYQTEPKWKKAADLYRIWHKRHGLVDVTLGVKITRTQLDKILENFVKGDTSIARTIDTNQHISKNRGENIPIVQKQYNKLKREISPTLQVLTDLYGIRAWFLIVSHEPAEVKKQAEPKYRSVSSRTEVPKRIKPNRSAEAYQTEPKWKKAADLYRSYWPYRENWSCFCLVSTKKERQTRVLKQKTKESPLLKWRISFFEKRKKWGTDKRKSSCVLEKQIVVENMC